MLPSTRKAVLVFVALVVFGMPLFYFFAPPLRFWFFTGLIVMGAICGLVIILKQRANTARFGSRMSFEEIIKEKDRSRTVQLLRYHLGWSPGKIAEELNRLGMTNHGLPWRQHDVQEIVKGIIGPL